MAAGSLIHNMAGFGYRKLGMDFNLMLQMVTGSIPTMDGPGFPITAGGGRHSIMDAGHLIIFMDGSGFQALPGLPPGLRGEARRDISDGLHLAPGWHMAIMEASPLLTGCLYLPVTSLAEIFTGIMNQGIKTASFCIILR